MKPKDDAGRLERRVRLVESETMPGFSAFALCYIHGVFTSYSI